MKQNTSETLLASCGKPASSASSYTLHNKHAECRHQHLYEEDLHPDLPKTQPIYPCLELMFSPYTPNHWSIKLLAESTSFSSDLTQVSPSTAKSSSLSLYTTGITEPTFKVGSTIAGLAEERSSTATIRQHRSNPFCYNTKEISNKRTQTWRTIASIKTIDSF